MRLNLKSLRFSRTSSCRGLSISQKTFLVLQLDFAVEQNILPWWALQSSLIYALKDHLLPQVYSKFIMQKSSTLNGNEFLQLKLIDGLRMRTKKYRRFPANSFFWTWISLLIIVKEFYHSSFILATLAWKTSLKRLVQLFRYYSTAMLHAKKLSSAMKLMTLEMCMKPNTKNAF